MLFVQHSFFAQNCEHTVSGFITDVANKTPIIGASVFIKETGKGAISNTKGYYQISNVCSGTYHLVISHMGCEDKEKSILIDNNLKVDVEMAHLVNMLDGIHLLNKHPKKSTQNTQVVKLKTIQKNTHLNLANQLENLTGVSTVKNGNSIAKPVVHGLYGNRVLLLNNNVVQSGQQWGNDHAPEIDPLMAGSIQVTKGVGALEYQGSSLGAVINVLPKEIQQDPHLHGNALYFTETNGNGHSINLGLEQNNAFLAWRVTGTLKKYGDRKTSDYYLNNTGFTEANLAVQIEKDFLKKWKSKWFLSTFNSTLGVLRGSHVTLSTQEENGEPSEYAQLVLQADKPQYTESNFFYAIDAPKQEVHHHLLKWENEYKINEQESYQFTYAGQIDQREEYDVRRSGRSELPALSLMQQTHFMEVKHQKMYASHWEIKKGIQYTFTDNTNNPETGILPLIPDYLSHQIGTFALLDLDLNAWKFEFGGRYNYSYQNVAYINRDATRTIEKYNNNFHNYSLAIGVDYHATEDLFWSLNVGLTTRNPEVNELYSYGLHQGVSGFEIGKPTLGKETGIKTTLGLEGNVDFKWFFEGLVYANYIADYIYLQPENEFTTTIRGTFPVFKYQQNNARIVGFDLGTNYLFSDAFKVGGKFSYIKGDNLSENVPLVYMPANNALFSTEFKGFKEGFLKNSAIELQYKYVFEQDHLLTHQDILSPPDAYQLVAINLTSEFYIAKNKVKTYAKLNNAFNTKYRDYLNRLRYFSDDLGRSLIVGIKVNF